MDDTYFPNTMKEVKAPKGTFRFLEDKSDFEQLVDRYDNFLFGAYID